jgi:hypothetical protein
MLEYWYNTLLQGHCSHRTFLITVHNDYASLGRCSIQMIENQISPNALRSRETISPVQFLIGATILELHVPMQLGPRIHSTPKANKISARTMKSRRQQKKAKCGCAPTLRIVP